MVRFLSALTAVCLLCSGAAHARKHRSHGRHRERQPLADSLPQAFYAPETSQTGRATFYRPRGGGACGLPGDSLVVAMNNAHYARADLCGACIEVHGPSGSVVARVVDRCPSCRPGWIDLSHQAFRRIAPLGAGRVDVSWRLEDCSTDSVIELHRDRSRCRSWASLQVRGHAVPLRSLEVLSDTGWILAPRQRHNRFHAQGLPDGPWTVRLTDAWNRSVVDSQVVLAPGTSALLRCRFLPIPRGLADTGRASVGAVASDTGGR